MEQSTFASKFLSRIQRIDAPQIESFVTQLVKEKDLLGLVLNSISEGVLLADAHGRLQFANEAARGLLSLRRGKVGNETLRRALRSRVLHDILEEFTATRAPILEREIRLRTPSVRIYSITAVPVGDGAEDGTDGGSLWIISDRTEIHRRAAEHQQNESIRSLGTLVSGVAHEIKNPLNSLSIHAQLITQATAEFAGEQEPSDSLERLQHSAGVLTEELARLNRIVDQFIKAARPPRLQLRAIAVNDVVSGVADLIRPDCESRHIALELDLEPDVPRIHADWEQIYQATLNVAKNGMEAIDKPDGRLVLRTRARGDYAIIEVEDNGCGIAEDDRLRIFEPYHTTKFDGSGLGLMIVFRIVTAHRGELGLDSRVGEGTTFRIALPVDEKPVRLLEGGAGGPESGLEE